MALAWDDKYLINVKAMDDQHKRLFALINELDDAMQSGKGRDQMDKTLNGLLDYCGTHFEDEQNLMKEHGYPGFDEHLRKHTAIVAQVKKMAADVDGGANLSAAIKLMEFLTGWLTKHIMGTDKEYATHLNERGKQ